MIYDSQSWHAEARDYPGEVPRENAATHIGVFWAWAVVRGLASEAFLAEHAQAVARLREKAITGRAFLIDECGGELPASAFNEEGQRFAEHYYRSGKYLNDYAGLLGRGAPSIYHANDTWQLYQLVEASIDQRFADWKAGKKWWEIWK